METEENNDMNTKTQTPKNPMIGSGISSTKQFLLSLLATTVSIALTFGTAAIIDHNKKQKEKREIVMMVVYDMYNSLEMIEQADSNIHKAMLYQRQIAADTSLFDKLRFYFIHLVPQTNYTETTEHIFSSNIETINTVGNVLFTENVAEFYQNRKLYKSTMCDSVAKRFKNEAPHTSLKALLDFDYSFEAILSRKILQYMQCLYEQSKEMMNVSDKEIEAYSKERMEIDKRMYENREEYNPIEEEILQYQEEIAAAKKRLHLE